MDLPEDLVLDTVENPCIAFFKEKSHAPEAPGHFYVMLPVNKAVDLVVCIITGSVLKRLEYYGERGTVLLPQRALPFITKESVIDCNRATLIPKSEFPNRIDGNIGLAIKARDLPDDLLKEVLLAIEDSRVVKRYIKAAVKSSSVSLRLFPPKQR